MSSTFTAFCRKTLEEIYQASSSTGNVNPEKLVPKVLQFFPNMKISVSEIESVQKDKLLNLLENKLLEAINDKKNLLDSNSPGAFVTLFRYLSLVQTDESWCKHLSRLELLKEEMILQSFTADRDVLEIYREKATQIFSSLMDDVRRNTVYSLFIYKPTADMKKWT